MHKKFFNFTAEFLLFLQIYISQTFPEYINKQEQKAGSRKTVLAAWKKSLSSLKNEISALKLKVVDLEGRSQRNIIKIIVFSNFLGDLWAVAVTGDIGACLGCHLVKAPNMRQENIIIKIIEIFSTDFAIPLSTTIL